MASPQKEPLRGVTTVERAALAPIVRASSERVDRVRRATALLAVAQGTSFARAARQAGFRGGGAVAALVVRFNEQGMAALTIADGRGRKPTDDGHARRRIVATARAQPERRGDGTATWSLGTLQRRLRRDGMARVGTSTIRRVLQDAGSSYQRTRTWCPTGTAQRVRKRGVVTVVDPRTEGKGADRAGVSVGGSGGDAPVVPRRGGAVPDDPVSGGESAAGRRPAATAARVSARRHRETADALPSRDRGGPGQGGAEWRECRAASVAASGTDADPRDATRRAPNGSGATADGPLGDVAWDTNRATPCRRCG